MLTAAASTFAGVDGASATVDGGPATTAHSNDAMDLVAPAIGLLLSVLFVHGVSGAYFLPRYALILVVVALGLPLLVAALWTRQRVPAAVALGFLAWATVSTVFSPNRRMAFWGEWLWGDGLVFLLALAGAWALGVHASPRGRRFLEAALVGAAVVNALVAVLQTLVDLSSIDMALLDNRPVGLWQNPVWLAGFLLGALWLIAVRVRHRPQWRLPAIALLAVALQLAGSRIALGLLVIALVVLVRPLGVRWAAVVAIAVVVGFALGQGIGSVGGASTASSRADVQGSGGFRERAETWIIARHAVANRPLLGAGPGRYQAATSRYETQVLADLRGPDHLFTDAHNIVVQFAVVTGIPGVLLLLAWFGTAAHGTDRSDPLFGFAALVLGVHLLQPLHVGLTPLALLALGATSRLDRAPPRPPALLLGLLTAAALAGGASFMVGGRLNDTGLATADVDALESAMRFLPPWTQLRLDVAGAYATEATYRSHPELRREPRAWAARAVRLDPTNPQLWKALAAYDVGLGRLDAAERELRRAIDLNPTSTDARNGLALIAMRRGDTAAAKRWFRDSLRIAPHQTDIRRRLASL